MADQSTRRLSPAWRLYTAGVALFVLAALREGAITTSLVIAGAGTLAAAIMRGCSEMESKR